MRKFVGSRPDLESRESGLQRHRKFLVFGFFTLLLATAAAFLPMPAAKAENPGFGPASPHPDTAANETSQGLVVTGAGLLTRSLSRIDQHLPHGISALSAIPVILESHGLGIADILTVSAREIGLHQSLRAPPVLPLN
jgi:hypothetical protein